MDYAARDEQMAAMYRQGVTLEKIGQKFGVTREAVRLRLKRIGITGKDGGVHLVAEHKRHAERESVSLRVRARWGIDLDLWRELRANGTIRRYEQQKRSARTRGIAFSLTFVQWYAVWQASGKLHLCGKGKGHYCMSRIKDTGGYELGNVHIQPSVENSREAVAKWRGKTKAYRGVFCLYPGRENAWLAKVGDTRLGYFPTAEAAVEAREKYIAETGARTSALGGGKGWTLRTNCKTRPYQMQCAGLRSYHATQEEAEAAYRAAVEQLKAAA